MSEGLSFNPPPMCDRQGCCDLSCVWPDPDAMPLVWEGDNA